MGIKVSLFNTSAVEKTEFTLNDDDYIDVDDDDDFIILNHNFTNKEKITKEHLENYYKYLFTQANDFINKNK